MKNTQNSQVTHARASHTSSTERIHCERRNVHRPLLAVLAALPLSVLACADADAGIQGEETPSGGEQLAAPPIMTGIRSKHAIIVEADLPGRTLKFIEPEPGVLIEVETGNAAEVRQASAQASDDTNLSSVERYERLTGRAAPKQLVRAQELVDEVRLRADAEAGPRSVVEPAPVRPTAQRGATKGTSGPEFTDRDWFLDNYCEPLHRYEFWFGAGGFETSLVQSGVNFLRTGAYSILGNVQYYVKYSTKFNSETLDIWLGAGQYGALRMSTLANATFGSSVMNANGDLYDHCINYHF